ncbi:MAG: AEC family transporter [Oscillospiraceae bacterium]|nr:AEC family transporter [Oscillospiraceae bacterium]
MTVFFNAASSVFVILLLTATGYFFGVTKWMSAEHKPFFEKYLLNFATPCMCLDNFLRNLSPELVKGSWKIIIVCFTGFCVCALLSALIAVLLRLPKNRAGAFVGMGGFSNALFVGYPMCRELFGEEAVVYVMLFFLSNSVLLFVVCYTAFACFSESKINLGKKRIIKIFINAPVLSSVIGIMLVMLGVSLPRPLASFVGYVSATISPLALLYCGFVIFETGIRNIRIDRGMVALPVMRFVIAPLICAALCRLFGVFPPASSVLTVEMSMPVITIIVVLAKEWDADVHYAAIGIVLTTLLCFVTIPVLMLFV